MAPGLLIIGMLRGFGLQIFLLGANGSVGAAGMPPGWWRFSRAFILGLAFFDNEYVRVNQ